MRISNLCDILDGEMLNEPQISAVEGFCFDADECKSAQCFICANSSDKDMQKAIENGAYALVFSHDTAILNGEIAFVKVADLNASLWRLLGFESRKKELKFTLLNSIQMGFFAKISNDKNAKILHKSYFEAFLQIMNANEREHFFCQNENFVKNLGGFLGFSQVNDAQPCNENSLFYMSFICDEIYYQNITLARPFLGELMALINHLNKNKIGFKIHSNLTLKNHFEPVFVDKFYNIAPFGNSYSVFIVENDATLFEKEANFMSENCIDCVVCAPYNAQVNANVDFRFSSFNGLKNIGNFHYALVFCDVDELARHLKSNLIQTTLF